MPMSNIQNIHVKVSGLNSRENYYFTFSNAGGNWPIRLSPLSGAFSVPSKDSIYEVKAYAYFCPAVELCSDADPNVFYNIPSANITVPGVDVGEDSLYSVLTLSIMEKSTDNVVFTYPCVVECENCAPKLGIEAEPVKLDKDSGNITSFSATVNGLIANQLYKYRFKTTDSNWPVTFIPESGYIQTPNSSYEIKSLVSFSNRNNDMSTLGTPDGSGMTLCYPRVYSDGQELYSMVEINLDPIDAQYQASTKSTIPVVCNDCIKQPSIFMPKLVELNNRSKNKINFVAEMNDLVVGAEYGYEFEGVDNNWPVALYPKSGTFTAVATDNQIPAKLTFCASTGLYPPDHSDILSYDVDRACAYTHGDIDKTARVRLKIYQLNCSTPICTISNEMTVLCDDCVPKPQVVVPTTSFLNSSTLNTLPFVASITNLVPGSEYSYEFESIDSNWPVAVYPVSGTITAQSSSMDIPVRLSFCRSVEVCPNTNPDVLDYTLDNTCVYNDGDFDKRVRLKINLHESNCEDPITVISNEMTVICNDCVPKIKVTLPQSSNLTSSTKNILSINGNVSNVVPGAKYSYRFVGVDANWPATIYPASGVVTADSSSISIPAKLTFARTPDNESILLEDSLLPYVLENACGYDVADQDIYSRLRLEISPLNCDATTSISNELFVTCVDCLPKVMINHGSPSDTLSGPGNTSYRLSTVLSDLVPGETYEYHINYLDSNWPTVVSKQSGEFLAVAPNKSIQTDMAFCFPSGSCAVDGRDVFLDYRTNLIYKNSSTKFLNINMSVTTKDCVGPTYTSSDFSLVCDNCLPNTNFDVKMSGSPILTLPLGCCSGTRLFPVSVVGASPGEPHMYTLTSPHNNIDFSPASGNITFGPDGNGTIMSLITTTFSNREQAIVECKLLNTVSHTEATDFLVVRCGPECNQ